MQYNFSNVLLIFHVKYFFIIGYDFELLLIKVVGATFWDTVYIRYSYLTASRDTRLHIQIK